MPFDIQKLNYQTLILDFKPQHTATLIQQLQNNLKQPTNDQNFDTTMEQITNVTFIQRMNLTLAMYQRLIDLILEEIDLNKTLHQNNDQKFRHTLQNFWNSFQTLLPNKMQNQYQIDFIQQTSFTINNCRNFFYHYLTEELTLIKPFELKKFTYWISDQEAKRILRYLQSYSNYYNILNQLNYIRQIQKSLLNQLKNNYFNHANLANQNNLNLIIQTYQSLNLDPDLKAQIKQWSLL